MEDFYRAKRYEFIYKSFRDVADCDYIAARALHRLKLFDQFLWSALQAVEKYLKTIILIYDGNTKDLGHDLFKGLIRVESIPDISWDFDEKTRDFLGYLTLHGGDRYFTRPRGTHGRELLQLDYVVWKIRRYCQDLQWLKKQQEEKVDDRHDRYIKWLQSRECLRNATKLRLFRKGHLEKVLDTKRFPKQREQLIYKNFFYGSYKKHKIKKFQLTATGANPAHFLFPEIYPWIKQRVKLSPEIKRYFEHTS
jgi:hypothetical protein